MAATRRRSHASTLRDSMHIHNSHSNTLALLAVQPTNRRQRHAFLFGKRFLRYSEGNISCYFEVIRGGWAGMLLNRLVAPGACVEQVVIESRI